LILTLIYFKGVFAGCAFLPRRYKVAEKIHLVSHKYDTTVVTDSPSYEKNKYFMLLLDDYIRITTILFLKKKSEEFKHFKIYKEMWKPRWI
jgi:hypothetical protein